MSSGDVNRDALSGKGSDRGNRGNIDAARQRSIADSKGGNKGSNSDSAKSLSRRLNDSDSRSQISRNLDSARSRDALRDPSQRGGSKGQSFASKNKDLARADFANKWSGDGTRHFVNKPGDRPTLPGGGKDGSPWKWQGDGKNPGRGNWNSGNWNSGNWNGKNWNGGNWNGKNWNGNNWNGKNWGGNNWWGSNWWNGNNWNGHGNNWNGNWNHWNNNWWGGNWYGGYGRYRYNSFWRYPYFSWFGWYPWSYYNNWWSPWYYNNYYYRRPRFIYGYGYGLWPYYSYNSACGYGGYYGGYPYSTYSSGYLGSTLAQAFTSAPATDATTVAPETEEQADASSSEQFAQQGEALFAAGDYAGAVREWRHAVLDDQENGTLVLMLGQALFATGSFEEAAGAVQQGLLLLPEENWGVVVNNYRELYDSPSDYTKQLRALEKAVREDDKNPALRFLTGYHYGFLGYPAEAVTELTKAKESAPEDQLAARLLALMQKKVDEKAGAAAPVEQPQPAAETQ